MRIKIVPPIPQTEEACRKAQSAYERAVRADTEIRVVNISKGPQGLGSCYERLLSDFFVLIESEKAERESFDAFIPACVLEKGSKPLKELLNILVLSTFECSMYISSLLGKKISVLALNEREGEVLKEKVRELGLEFKLASIRSLNVKPEDGKDAIQKRLKSAGKSAVEKDGADIVVIGCAQLGFEIEKELREELGVPVILPGLVTVKVAEALIDLGLKQSKKAYPTPPIKIHDFLSIT